MSGGADERGEALRGPIRAGSGDPAQVPRHIGGPNLQRAAGHGSPPRSLPGGLAGLEAEVGVELTTAGASSPLGLFAGPQDGWLVDPAEVQSEQTGLRSLLGAVRALEAGRDLP